MPGGIWVEATSRTLPPPRARSSCNARLRVQPCVLAMSTPALPVAKSLALAGGQLDILSWKKDQFVRVWTPPGWTGEFGTLALMMMKPAGLCMHAFNLSGCRLQVGRGAPRPSPPPHPFTLPLLQLPPPLPPTPTPITLALATAPPESGSGSGPPPDYPLLLLNDGQNLFDGREALWPHSGGSVSGQSWRAVETAALLIRAGELPPFLMAGIDHAGCQRSWEYCPYRPGQEGGRGGCFVCGGRESRSNGVCVGVREDYC